MNDYVLVPVEVAAIEGLVDVLDRFRVVDPDPVDPAACDVFVCPCGAWQLETSDDVHWASPTATATYAVVMGHRTKCPALDLLAGLAGIRA